MKTYHHLFLFLLLFLSGFFLLKSHQGHFNKLDILHSVMVKAITSTDNIRVTFLHCVDWLVKNYSSMRYHKVWHAHTHRVTTDKLANRLIRATRTKLCIATWPHTKHFPPSLVSPPRRDHRKSTFYSRKPWLWWWNAANNPAKGRKSELVSRTASPGGREVGQHAGSQKWGNRMMLSIG